MNVSMWMSRDAATIGLDTPVADAAKLMTARRVRRLLVAETVTGGQRLLGIVSTKDVLHAFPPHINPFAIESPDARSNSTTVAQIMTARPKTTTPDAPIEEAAALMCTHKIGSLPVLRDGWIAGIITESDIFRAFTSLFGSDEKGARITFDVSHGEDVFELVGKLSRRHHLKVLSLIWTRHDELPVCVVRVAGHEVEKMLEELWNSGHAVVNVLHFEAPKEKSILPPSPLPFEPFIIPKSEPGGLYPSG
ncbi:MAG TPA: CBS domain-containing protein [Candidatus Sulfotelmatobacter sp.]|jgi:acetoin utilization protein AcuB|nr:CBS domain-containing protein [Candidatus Sulfotelmatobacter sp.]